MDIGDTLIVYRQVGFNIDYCEYGKQHRVNTYATKRLTIIDAIRKRPLKYGTQTVGTHSVFLAQDFQGRLYSSKTEPIDGGRSWSCSGRNGAVVFFERRPYGPWKDLTGRLHVR